MPRIHPKPDALRGMCAGRHYDQILDRVLHGLEPRIRQADRERSEAPALLAELLSHTPGRREVLIRNARRFRSFSLGLLLLDQSREVSAADPRGGEGWALLALHLTDFLDPRVYGTGLIEDLRGRCWSLLAALPPPDHPGDSLKP